MATAGYWAEPKVVREQIVLFAPSLDSMISEDHEVRLLDETLRRLDWSEWESEYPRLRGQPPIHPRVLAGIWLYAMMRRIRTSRPLEYACGHNIDFIWLAEGLVLRIKPRMNAVRLAESRFVECCRWSRCNCSRCD